MDEETTSNPLESGEHLRLLSDTEDNAALEHRELDHLSLPEWFLMENVKTSKELADSQNLEEPKFPGYSELRDVTTYVFHLSQHESSVLLQSPSDDNDIGFLDSVVLSLAKDLHASLISIELEDLADLGWEFDRQHQEFLGEKSDKSSARNEARKTLSGLAEYYFAAQSESDESTEAWDRNKMALSAVLNAPRTKCQSRLPKTSVADTSVEEKTPPVLLHIREAQRMMNIGQDWRFLDRLRDLVQQRRQAGEVFALIVTTPSTKMRVPPPPGYYPYNSSTGEIFHRPRPIVGRESSISAKFVEKIAASQATTIEMTSCSFPKVHSNWAVYISRVNTRRLKYILRSKIPHHSLEILLPSSDWSQAFDGDINILGKAVWSDDDIERVATQIVGRIWGKPHLDLEDVRIVLTRMNLFITSNQNGDMDGATDEESQNETEENESQHETEEKVMTKKDGEEAIANILGMVGLSSAKEKTQKIKAKIEASIRQKVDITTERFGTILIGNAGTGKSTFARHWAKYLHACGILGTDTAKKTTGVNLVERGIDQVEKDIKDLEDEGGVYFIDDAHYLLTSDSVDGERVLDFLVQEIESNRGKIVFILAGREKGMRDILGHGGTNIRGLLPHFFHFTDFSDHELLTLLGSSFTNIFGEKMEVEGGLDGLYMRIAARRLGSSRGSSHFSNSWDVENFLSLMWERQSTRLAKNRSEKRKSGITEDECGEDEALRSQKDTTAEVGKDHDPAECRAGEKQTDPEFPEVTTKEIKDVADPEDYQFTKEDILGPDPSDALLCSPAWVKIKRLTGLQTVKESIASLLELVKTNYKRELEEKPLLKVSLNRLFLGPPGTGKTLVAKLYGQLLADIGILSKGEVIVKNPSDFIEGYIGDSEKATKAALSAAVGNVLVIDEAYMLYSGDEDGTGNRSDSFRQGITDTLVANISGEPGEDRCVLLLGYAKPMVEMLQNSNPGLSRKFPPGDAFWFDNFSLQDLESILRSKLQDYALEASDTAIRTAMDVLEKASSRVNFGNGGEVENLISKAKINYIKRMSALPKSEQKWVFEPVDFDPEFNRNNTAASNLQKLFSDMIGFQSIIKKLEQYQCAYQAMKLKDLDAKGLVPTNFVFKGPPGTGKTTVARKIAQVYYDMGYLAEPSLVECSVSDLVGKWVGHSGPKTEKVLERSLGKVLFIDEAYRLVSDDNFSSEVVSEVVDLLTKPKFNGKLVIILAGYEEQMNDLLSVNPGLASRFSDEFDFPPLGPSHSLELLNIKLGSLGIKSPILDQQPRLQAYKYLLRLMRQLAGTPSWGNARDVETVAKNLGRIVFANTSIDEDELLTYINDSLLKSDSVPHQQQHSFATTVIMESGSSNVIQAERVSLRSGIVPPGRTFPYESGYGDFCFLRLRHRQCARAWPEGNSQAELIEMKPFPFMRLPREIRDNIYKLVISPICKVDEFDGISLRISPPMQILHWDPMPCTLVGITITKSTRAILRTSKSSTNQPVTSETCPTRTPLFVVNSPGLYGPRTRIALDVSSFVAFEQFLEDQPAVWEGIKCLYFNLGLSSVQQLLPEKFPEICERIAKCIHLENLHLVVVCSVEEIQEFLNTSEKRVWAKGVRKLTVARNFTLQLLPVIENWTRSEKELEDACEAIIDRCEQAMEDELCPDSLRPKEKPLDEITDVERYMATHL